MVANRNLMIRSRQAEKMQIRSPQVHTASAWYKPKYLADPGPLAAKSAIHAHPLADNAIHPGQMRAFNGEKGNPVLITDGRSRAVLRSAALTKAVAAVLAIKTSQIFSPYPKGSVTRPATAQDATMLAQCLDPWAERARLRQKSPATA
jgi:hypothetical protein